MDANWANQTIWTGDNIYILRGMNSESVDLIYLDPPFNSNANYAAPIGSQAAGAEFKDTWTLSDIDVEWINLLEGKHPALHRILLATTTDSDKSYLAYMAIRLLEMKRILKTTGSIYLHCDPTMSHYLKLAMDAIFGKSGFRNEIIWSYRRYTARSNRFQREHDVILMYGKEAPIFNVIFEPYGEKSGKRDSHYKQDETGKWFRWQKRRGEEPYKLYLSEDGRRVGDVWQIPHINASAKERIGYPTQKPLRLLQRIIKASSNENDVVLDPFCGCATACIAAQIEHRQWAGIDISSKAAELVKLRMDRELGMFHEGAHRTDIPQRTDLGKLPRYNDKENRERLYGQQAGYCAGCQTHFELRNLEVDHIISRNKGGTDHIENLQLLCGSCNRIKGDRGMEYLRVKLQL